MRKDKRLTPAARMASVDTLARLALNGAGHRHWYANGVPALQALADRMDISFGALCDVVAITSPRVHVRRNIRLAVEYGREIAPWPTDAHLKQTPGDIARRYGMMHGVAVSLLHWHHTRAIRGPKTSAFAAALRGDPSALVLDVWMSRALGVPQDRLFTGSNFAKADQRMARTARRLGWSVAETQAAVWSGAIQRHTKSNGQRVYAEAPSLASLVAEYL